MTKTTCSKRHAKSNRALQAAIAAVSVLAMRGTASATTTYLLDVNGTTAGLGTPTGNLNWDPTTTIWTTDTTGNIAPVGWVQASFPKFTTGGTFTLTVTGDEQNAGMQWTTLAQNLTINATSSTVGDVNITGAAQQGFFGFAGSVITFNAPIIGNGGPIFETGGTFALNNTGNSFSAGMKINSATTVTLGAVNVIPAVSVVAMSAGTLTFNSHDQTFKGLTSGSGSTNVGLGTATLTLTGNGATVSSFLGNDITGAGGITLTGGTQIFSTNYSWTGPTKILGGLYKVDSIRDAGSSSSLGASTTANSAANLVFGGGTLWAIVNSGLETNRNFTFTASSGIQSDGPQTATFTGNMTATNTAAATFTLSGISNPGLVNILGGVITDGSGGGKNSILKTGSNTWQLGGAAGNTGNSYSGATTISGGTLGLGSTNAIGASSSVSLAIAGTTLATHGFGTNVGGLSMVAGSSITGGGTITHTNADASGAYLIGGGDIAANLAESGVGAGIGVGLKKSGAGTSTITGNMSYTGNTTVSAGTLFFNGGNTQSVGTIDVLSSGKVGGTSFINGPVTIESGGHFVAGNSHGTGTTPLAASGSGTIEFKAGSNLDFTVLSGGGSDILDASSALPNALTFDGTAGQTSLNIAATGGGTYPIIFYNGSYSTPGNIGTNEFTTAGNVTLIDDGFSTISATVAFNPSNWLNPLGGDWNTSPNWDTTFPNSSGATATLGNAISTNQTVNISSSVTVGLLTFDNTQGAHYTVSAGASQSLTLSSPAQATIQDNNGTHFISAPLVLTSDTSLVVTNALDSMTLSGAISGTGSFSKAGNGSALISGPMTNAPATTSFITDTGSGNLSISGAITFPTVNSSTILNTGSGLLSLNGVISGSNTVSTLIVNSGSGTISIGGVADTYTGKVIISSGTVALAGDLSLGVGPGGTVLDTVTIHNGGTVQLLNGASLASTRGFTIDTGGTATIAVASGATATWGGYITLGASAGTGASTLTKSGAGTLYWSTNVPGLPNYNQLNVTGGIFQVLNGSGPFPSAGISLSGGGTIAFQANTSAGALATSIGSGGGGLRANNTFTTTWAGVISGGAGNVLTIGVASNTGTVVLTGANTYSGGTNLAGGTLTLGSSSVASPASGPVGTGTLTLTSGTIQGNAVARTITNPVTVAGDMIIGGVLADNLSFTTGAWTLTASRVLTVNSVGATTIAGAIGQSATASLTKSGTGSLTLSGVNTYAGGFIQSAGTTTVSGGSLEASTGNLNIVAGTLNLNNATQTIGNLTGAAGSLVLGTTATEVLTVIPTAGANLVTPITGAAGSSLVYNPATNITETFSGANAFGGGLTIASGTLDNNNAAGIGGVSNSLTFSGGTLFTGVAPTASATRNITINTGGGTINSNGLALTFGNVNGTDTLTKTGAGTATVNYLRTTGVTVSGGGLKVVAGGGNTSVVTNISTSGGPLDLNDNKLVVKAGGTPIGTLTGSTYSGVTGQIQQGYASGAWTGNGIVTSQSNANSTHILTTLGVDTADDALGVTVGTTAAFGGQTVTSGDVLVMYTYAGDANLTGAINGDDYAKIDAGFGSGGALTGYANGDFNYDGKINADDYFLIDRNYSAQGAPFSVSPAPGLEGLSGGSSLAGVSAVPEPSTIGLISLAAMSCLGRRRRGNSK